MVNIAYVNILLNELYTDLDHIQIRGYVTTRALGIYSLRGETSYRQISRSLETASLGVVMIVSLWKLTGIGSGAVKFQSDWSQSLNCNLAASRIHEIWR